MKKILIAILLLIGYVADAQKLSGHTITLDSVSRISTYNGSASVVLFIRDTTATYRSWAYCTGCGSANGVTIIADAFARKWQTLSPVAGSGGGGISGLTTNTVPKAASATTLTNSSITDDGTTVTLNTNVKVSNAITGTASNGIQLGYANSSTIPVFVLKNPSSSADETTWRWYVSTNQFKLGSLNDAGNAENTAIQIDRSGNLPTHIRYPNGETLLGGVSDQGDYTLQLTGNLYASGNLNFNTVVAGLWNGTQIGVPYGGTGLTTTTAYGLITGGTTSTGNFQNAGTGTSGQIYISGGASALGTWSSPNSLYASGTYTPTVTDGANTTGTPSVTTLFYQRVGDRIEVWGELTVEPTTTATLTDFFITLPVSTSIDNTFQLAGTASSTTVSTETVNISGEIANDRAYFSFTPISTASRTCSFRFTYFYIAP